VDTLVSGKGVTHEEINKARVKASTSENLWAE
jgi:hypothetical protein